MSDVSVSLLVAALCAAIGALNTLFLPDPAIRHTPSPSKAVGDAARLPTLAAAGALLRPHIMVFCIATFLLNVATASYYGFYTIYLKETLRLGSQWLAPIQIFGGIFEVLFMFSYGWIVRRFGIRGLALAGTVTVIARMALLGLMPTIFVAVATQALHGLMVLVLQVAPVVYLNEQAEDRYRHSMQGLYTMVGIGVARIVGSLIAGSMAHWSLPGMFTVSAALSAVALVLLIVAFREPAKPNTQSPGPAPQEQAPPVEALMDIDGQG